MQKHIKKKREKPNKKKEPAAKPVPLPGEEKLEDSEEDGFGGIPDRDMKKNLGCG